MITSMLCTFHSGPPVKATRPRVWAVLAAAGLLVAGLEAPGRAQPVTETFEFTGQQETFLVPPNVCELTIEAAGAQGGVGSSSTAGGNGGSVAATVTVTPEETLVIFVGGRGGGGGATGGEGGFNGGDSGGDDAGTSDGGGGGGASDVRQGGADLDDRIVVAGGGGGGGGHPGGGTGGAGGQATGANGASGQTGAGGGGGGTQTAGGAGGSGTAGTDGGAGALGTGGAGPDDGGGGGGGGGYYGGGGGEGLPPGGTGAGGGGGGSSFAVETATNVVHTQGDRAGNGQVTITFEPDPVNCAQVDLELGKTVTVNEDATATFILEAINSGPDAASGVVVVDTLPACVAFTEDTCGGTEIDGEWTWALGEFAADETAGCELGVDASACAGEGEQTNTATVAGEQDDSDSTSDTAEAAFEIEPEPTPTADLSLTHEATVNPTAAATSSATAKPPATATGPAERPRAAADGDATVIFAVTATNTGPDDATGAVVTNELPECTQIVSDDCGGEAGPPWTWTVGDLATDASASCELTVDAAQCSGAQTATAEVTADQSDPDPDDNTATASFEIEVVPALPTLALVLLAALLAFATTRLLRRERAVKR